MRIVLSTIPLVGPKVLVQVVFPSEFLVTVGAREWPFHGVGLHMTLPVHAVVSRHPRQETQRLSSVV